MKDTFNERIVLTGTARVLSEEELEIVSGSRKDASAGEGTSTGQFGDDTDVKVYDF